MPRVQTGCRDCGRCNRSAFEEAFAKPARAMGNIATLGTVTMMRSKCGACRHPMADHYGQQATPVVVQVVSPSTGGTPPGWYPDPAGSPDQRYFDGVGWTDHYHPPRAASTNPPVAAPPHEGIADELAKLAALRDSGVLTEGEFAQRKARLLAQ